VYQRVDDNSVVKSRRQVETVVEHSANTFKNGAFVGSAQGWTKAGPLNFG
jgi:hypothetical protein